VVVHTHLDIPVNEGPGLTRSRRIVPLDLVAIEGVERRSARSTYKHSAEQRLHPRLSPGQLNLRQVDRRTEVLDPVVTLHIIESHHADIVERPPTELQTWIGLECPVELHLSEVIEAIVEQDIVLDPGIVQSVLLSTG
jgi:hypothetical protein